MAHHKQPRANSLNQAGGPSPESGEKAPFGVSIQEAAERLARSHYKVDPGIQAVYRLDGPDPNDRRIKLLEVNEQTIPAGIVPVGFPPHPATGLHFQSVVIEVTPGEYERIRRRDLKLPDGWTIGDLYERPISSSS